DRATKPGGSVEKHFEDFVGCEALISRLRRCQTVVKNTKSRGKDPRELIPFTFLFCGPLGTGKTTAAKRIGQIFYEMGFLATPEVMDRSATHLIGEYVGHTGPKTTKLFDSALGRVLFIDESYKLDEGSYTREAVVEMINLLGSERYRKKLVVILAGYQKDIHQLMATNPGFTSRLPEVINFDPLTPGQCAQLLFKRMVALDIETEELEQSTPLVSFLEAYFGKISQLPFWGNGRDVGTLASSI
ncbi:P-loop containing nucleoside triphosphate hydrolase protein, partial [Lasiosphaeris hirsuta]